MMAFGNRRTNMFTSYFKCLFVILYCNEQYMKIMVIRHIQEIFEVTKRENQKRKLRKGTLYNGPILLI
jgi:hypothetical protein